MGAKKDGLTPPGGAGRADVRADVRAEAGSLAVPSGRDAASQPKIAYMMSRFPRITETFILYEILALKKLGFAVEVYPLLLERKALAHPEVEKLAPAVRFCPLLSLAVLKANWHYLRRGPRRYLRLLSSVLAATFRSPNFFAGALAFFPKAVRFAYDMERGGVTHIHAHFANHPALAALIAHSLSSIPFSFTAHGSDIHVDQHAFDFKVEAAAFAVMISSYNKEFLIRRFGPGIAAKMHVIHCGVDPDVFTARAPKQGDGFEILCVASFREVKGHRHLVNACRLLMDRGVDFRCHFVGEGPLRRRVERQVASLGLGAQVCFHGALSRPDVLRMMGTADVVVLPSIEERAGRREGIPVTLMEAMACALPVVSSRISGIPELVEDGRSGILTEAGDESAIADALVTLSKSPELRGELGRRGRAKVIEEFHLERNVSRLAELFRQSRRVTGRNGALAR